MADKVKKILTIYLVQKHNVGENRALKIHHDRRVVPELDGGKYCGTGGSNTLGLGMGPKVVARWGQAGIGQLRHVR